MNTGVPDGLVGTMQKNMAQMPSLKSAHGAQNWLLCPFLVQIELGHLLN